MCEAAMEVLASRDGRPRKPYTLGLQANEVPKVIVCALALRHLVVRLGFHCVDDIWKLDGILNEEHGDYGQE